MVSESCFYQGFRLLNPATGIFVAGWAPRVVAEVFAEVLHE
jgi:hypothetical protein